MKKNLVILLAALLVGCSTPQRDTYDSLAAVGKAVDLAETEYVEGVLVKRYPTNDFPKVQRAYNLFQVAYSNAVWRSARNTNLVGVPLEVKNAADETLKTINQAK
jgi:uncharacterized lipoprotein YmbA